jgi:hypothetical protein
MWSDHGWSFRAIMGAFLIAGLGALSNGCGGVPDGLQPPPASFSLTAPADSSVVDGVPPTLIWTDSIGETRYYVEIDEDAAFSTPFTASVAADRTSYMVLATQLTGSTKYYWRVRAINSTGPTTASNAPRSFTTTAAPIQDFKLKSPVSGATITTPPTLEWTDAGNESAYIVHISDLPTFTPNYFTALITTANTTTYVPSSYIIFGSNTTYYWEVLATFSGTSPIVATNGTFSFVAQ